MIPDTLVELPREFMNSLLNCLLQQPEGKRTAPGSRWWAVVLASLFLASTPANALTVNATFNAVTDIPITASSYTATGNTISFTLGFAPVPGTNLTVIHNTGTAFIQGTFNNLPQGAEVALSYEGTTYNFVAHYYGGVLGRNLVLHWAYTRPVAWGANSSGQLGSGIAQSNIPVTVDTSGVLTGKTVLSTATGRFHNLALCSDGTLVAWGGNAFGQLGNNSTTDSTARVAVDTTGILAGKTVIAAAAGACHSLALCSDGTLVAWGQNTFGQLGTGGTNGSTVPVAVNTSGVLAGKSVVGIAAGAYHSLALCSDGSVAAWGYNLIGQLGNNSTTDSTVPVAVNASGILADKTVIGISAGAYHSLALCQDGSVCAWGANWYGNLGNNGRMDSAVPVPVNQTGVLAGKSVAAIAAGCNHNIALCSDGTLAAWGSNGEGALGISGISSSATPVLVNAAGALADKTVVQIAAGADHSLAFCTDGSVAAWGYNVTGALGNNSMVNSATPVAASTVGLPVSTKLSGVSSGPYALHSLGMIGSLVQEPVITGATTTSGAYGSALSYTITASSSPTSFGATGLPSGLTINPLSGLISGTPTQTGTFSVTVSATNSAGTVTAPLTITISKATATVTLGNLSATYDGSLKPVTTTTNPPGRPVLVTYNGSYTVPGAPGSYTVEATVNDPNYQGTASGTLVIADSPLTVNANFTSGTTVPLTVTGYCPSGGTVNIALSFAPPTGATLTIVKITGPNTIQGTFQNLAHGQAVTLTYGGTAYHFIANYFGGSGRDLVLQWADVSPMGWGYNRYGQLGNNNTVESHVPIAVGTSGALAGKTVIKASAGADHSLFLCSDGTLAAAGANDFGQLGNTIGSSMAPVVVNTSGVLAGKTVTAISAGNAVSFAVCSDGTLAAWGDNSYGQLGNNGTTNSNVPVAVNSSGALAGKTVVAVSAGMFHCLALCSDGTLVAWGDNAFGQLGNNSTTSSTIPVAVNTSGALAGKTVVAIASGLHHCLALCSDGRLVAWGLNTFGQLGNNSTTNSTVPVVVNTAGTLAGKTAVSVGGGSYHSLALCSDGSVHAWGGNANGYLGNNSTTNSSVPVAVNTAGVLSGKTVVAIVAGTYHSLAICSDGAVVGWGMNGNGNLGNNSSTSSSVPVALDTTGLAAGQVYNRVFSGPVASYNFGLVAKPATP